MKNNKTLIIVGLIILAIIAAIFLFPSKYENKLKTINLDKTANLVINRTDVSGLDTIYGKGLELLGIRHTRVLIKQMTDSVKHGFGEEIDIVWSVLPQKDYYLVYTKTTDAKTMVRIASHELIHLKQ